MRHLLQRHPMRVRAYFRRCLVLTYALPEERLAGLIPPGLVIDGYKGFGFVAVAMVQTEDLHPAWLPARFGRDFFLTGYRVFVTYRSRDGRRLRGLRILRSDTDSRLMTIAGNLLTHYHYRRAQIAVREVQDSLTIDIATPGSEADLAVRVDLCRANPTLPHGSPFQNMAEARRFAGPLPYTFDFEPQTHSIIRIHGERSHWRPRLVDAEVSRITFFDHPPFTSTCPVFASAFYVENIPYAWARGVREPLRENAI